MAGDAADALLHVDAVIEVDELRQVVNALPRDRRVGAVAGADRFQRRAAEPDFLMAIHAGLRWGDAGKRRRLDGGVAIAAINAKVADVVLVTERDWLNASNVCL